MSLCVCVSLFIHTYFTLKYTGSTLCRSAWALPTSFSTEATLSELSRLSTSVLMAFITLWACFLSWALLSSSSGSSMCLNWLKYCLDDGKFTNSLQRRKVRLSERYEYEQLLRSSANLIALHPVPARSWKPTFVFFELARYHKNISALTWEHIFPSKIYFKLLSTAYIWK